MQNSLLSWSSGKDGFEEWATLEIEARLPLSLSPDEWYEELKKITGPVATCERTTQKPIQAYRGEKNTPLVRSFLKAIRGEEGKPGFVVKTGTADMNIVGPVWQCPMVAYGPGDSNLDHTPNEHLLLQEYDKAVKVLKEMLVELTTG